MKISRISALAALLVFVFGGCRQSGGNQAPDLSAPSPASSPVLRLAHYLEIDNAQKTYDVGMGRLLQRFTDETGVEIEYEYIPWDKLDEKLIVTNQAGEPAGDLFALATQKLAYLANARALLPLDEWFDAAFEREDFNPKVLANGTYPGDGKLYLIMQSIHIRGLWYNKDYVDAPPKTWEELVVMGREISRPEDGFYAFGFWGGSHYGSAETTLGPFTWALGGSLSGEDGQAAWDNEAAAGAIRFMSDCVNTYQISPPACLVTRDYVDIQDSFRSGKLAMIQDGNFALSRNSLSGLRDKLGFAPCPGPEGPIPNFSNGWAWGIPSRSTQPELAWKFIQWFEQEDIQMDHALLEGGIPTRVSLYENEAFSRQPFPSFIENLAQYGRPFDPFVYYQEGLEALSTAAAAYCQAPESDLEALLNESAKQFNEKYY